MRQAGFQGFLSPKRQDLLMPPIPGLPKPDKGILGANHSLVRHVRDEGMRDVSGWMAQLVRRDPKAGVVEARDFVDQLEQLIPGEGTKAIRGILHALADTPQHQQAFFGGPVTEIAPVGVFEHDDPQRYEEAIKTRPWEEYEQGRKQDSIRDMAWRPERDGPLMDPQPPELARPLTPEEEARRMRPLNEGPSAESKAPIYDDGLLDPARWNTPARDEDLSGKAAATDTEDDQAHAIQTAQAQGQQSRPNITRTENAWVYDDPKDIKERAQQNGGWLGRDRQCVALLQGTNPNLGHTTTWRAGDQIRGPGDPPLKPGTAIATFQPDQNANGELRYPSPGGQARGPDENIRRHAGIFMGYGEQGGRQGVFILDQFDGSGRGRSRDNGETSIRFYPFERAPGDGGYRAGEFHAIRPRK
jgi:hypothetical protein